MCQETIEFLESEINKIVDLYLPDSVVISKEISRMARANTGNNSGLYALTRPYTRDGSQYYEMFLALLEYDTLYINSYRRKPEQVATNYMSVCGMYNIISQARAISLLTISNGSFSKTLELDEYIYWAVAAKRFQDAAIFGKVNKKNIDEEISYYFGGIERYFGNYDEKVKRLSDEIVKAYCILRDSDVRVELDRANDQMQHKKKVVKMFKTKYNKHEVKDMLNSGSIRNIFNLILKLYNSANRNCFDIDTNNSLELFSFDNFSIDPENGIINII